MNSLDEALLDLARIERTFRRCPVHNHRVAINAHGGLMTLCPTCAVLAARGEAQLRRHTAEQELMRR